MWRYYLWLSLITSRFYRPQLSDLLTERPQLVVAGIFGLLYVIP